MNKLQEINKAIQDILDTVPTHSNKIYLLEDYIPDMRDILVMFDSYITERKLIYFDKNGAYIAGRGQGQGDKTKMYFSEFERLNLSEEAIKHIKEEVSKINKKLDNRIPSKEIKPGMLCKEFGFDRNNNVIYAGKVKVTTRYKEGDRKYGQADECKFNVYCKIFNDAVIDIKYRYDGHKGEIENGYFYYEKNKIRFTEIIKQFSIEDIEFIRDSAFDDYKKYRYGRLISFEWMD